MTTKRNGGPAFPEITGATRYDSRDHDKTYDIESVGGMSLRDWFAGQVLAGLASGMRHPSGAAGVDKAAKDNQRSQQSVLAGVAYELADAMLAERDEETS